VAPNKELGTHGSPLAAPAQAGEWTGAIRCPHKPVARAPGRRPLRHSDSSRRSSALLTALLGALILALLAVLEHMSRSDTRELSGVVTRVYDGDTVEVDGYRKVRLLGIDALDAHEPRRTAQQAAQLGLSEGEVRRWAQRATSRARELLAGRSVRLECGPERTDAYGRTLALLYFRQDGEEVLFNALLLAEGLAVAYGSFEHPGREEFLRLEREARARHVGLWQEARRVP